MTMRFNGGYRFYTNRDGTTFVSIPRNRNGVLALSVAREWLGAYPSFSGERLVFSTRTGERLSVGQLLRPAALPELARHIAGLGFDGVELPVRPGYPVHPDNVTEELPRAAHLLGRFDYTDLKSVASKHILRWVDTHLEDLPDHDLAAHCFPQDVHPAVIELATTLWSFGLAPVRGST